MSGPVQLATSKGQLPDKNWGSAQSQHLMSDGEKCAVKSFKKHGLSDARRTDLKNEAPCRPFQEIQLRSLQTSESRIEVPRPKL